MSEQTQDTSAEEIKDESAAVKETTTTKKPAKEKILKNNLPGKFNLLGDVLQPGEEIPFPTGIKKGTQADKVIKRAIHLGMLKVL